MAKEDLYPIFRRTCARLSKPSGQVRVYVHDAGPTPSVNFLEPGACDSMVDSEDYREIHPDWLRPVEGKVELDIKVEHSRSDKYLKVFLTENGAWKEAAGSIPLFPPAVKRLSLRDEALATFGEAMVVETEQFIEETVRRLLAAPELKKLGVSTRAQPKITHRWTAGKSRGGVKGLSFALWQHVMKPENGAVFKEYASFASDPEIGNFTGTRQQCLSILAAHELAHWVQYSPKVKRPEMRWRPPHGEGFRVVYRLFRKILASQ